LIYDIRKANDPVFNCHFKLDDLLVKSDVFNLKLTVIFFYFLGILKNFIHLLINVRLLGVNLFCDPEFATLDDEEMACSLSLREQVGTFDWVARLKFRNQLFYSTLIKISEQNKAL